ncbi:MAG: hypothetical protein QOG89_112 [Thermomicrobiales bacterium]|nr:hypothetical protein [Thermomicrobiales bacterium]
MRRTILIMRLLATLGLALWLVGGTSSVPASAQSEGETTQQTVDEETPPSDEGTEPEGNATGESTEEQAAEPVATGTLTVLVYLCTSGGDAGTGAIVPAGEFSPDESCTESTATIAIDGSEPTTVEGTADFALDAGTHTVTDTTTGATLDVEIVGDEVTSVSVVAYAAAEEEAAAAEESQAQAEETTIRLITHDCVPKIHSADDLVGLDKYGTLTVCPVVPLDGDETLSLGDENVLSATSTAIDFPDSPDCDPDTGRCFAVSYYEVTVPGGRVMIADTTEPEIDRFDAAALEPNDAVTADGQFEVIPPVDDPGDPLVVHLYHFSPGISVVVHTCPDTITADDFADINDIAAKLKACPAVTQEGDNRPEDAVNGGTAEFDLTVEAGEDAALITSETFLPELVCETEFDVALDADAGTDLCLAGYSYREVPQGKVTVTETPPDDQILGAAVLDLAPVTGDEGTVDVKDGVVTLDTTGDDDVILHLFNFAVASDNGGGGNETGGGGGNTGGGNNTGGNTGGGNNSGGNAGGGNTGGGSNNTGGGNAGGGDDTDGDGSGGGNAEGGTGSVAIYMLYCVADSEYTDIQVLNPGDNVDPSSFGDDTCVQDANEFQITEFSSNDLAPFDVGADGFEQLDLPVTEGENPHLITDTWSGTTASFEIASGAVTPIVVLAYESWEAEEEYYEDEYEDEYYEDEYEEYIDDEEAVESGEDLPDTGVAVAPGSSQSQALLLGMTGLLVLGGAYGLRRAASR